MAAVSHWREPRLPCPVAIKCVAALLRCALYLNTHTLAVLQCNSVLTGESRFALTTCKEEKKSLVF